MDASLPSKLNGTDATTRKERLSDLLLHEAAPLVRKVLRQRLSFYLNHQGANPQQPEAENLYQDILLRVLQRSQAWLADAEQHTIHNYRNLVITIATNACHDYLRAKAPTAPASKTNCANFVTDIGISKSGQELHTNRSAALRCGQAKPNLVRR